ncbi:putative nuclease HARBI1 [Mytilus trossulus]|uniref:putative nuclease HARBI1 n=1 Tax=Mytilus trossulus TaxID=6551 RepID=UPI00300796C0
MASKMSKQMGLLMLQQFLDDDDDTDNLLYAAAVSGYQNLSLCYISILKKRNKIPRILNYAETVIPEYSNEEFRRRFRMNKETFLVLVEQLRGSRNYKTISLEKQVLIFLKYVSSQMTLQAIADYFGVCEYSVFQIVKCLANVICEKLLAQYIRWPSNNQVQENVQKFSQKGFPGVIGAIDGTHIPIRAPKEYHENYINRKSFHSIILQGICDHNMHFLDVFSGWPGSVHDSRVFKNSLIFNKFENDSANMFFGNSHLLGDSAYGLQNWLMTPYKDYGNLTRNQRKYNFVHSSTRMVIEHAFGALKGRFRRLKYLDILDIQKAVEVSLSCCVLHELCLSTHDDMTEYIEEGVVENTEVNNFVEVHNPTDNAETKRSAIMDNLI